VEALTGKGGSNVRAFVALLDVMREMTRGLTLRQIIEHVIDASGLEAFYKNEREGAERLENLGELVNAAEAFVTQEGFGKDAVALPLDEQGGAPSLDAGPGATPEAVPASDSSTAPRTVLAPDAETGEVMSPLAAFLAHASLEAGDNQAQAGQDAVQMMTVHSAKGLEFDCVFITGLEEQLFPHENSATEIDGLEEERRLMYVAITRARQRLYLSFSQTRMLHGQTRYHVRSRFLNELPEAALKWITPRNAGFASGFSRDYQPAWRSATPPGVLPRDLLPEAPRLVPKDTPYGLRPGQSVFHNKFGEGVVVTLEGQGGDARAQIKFGRHGSKWLALSVAKLTPVD
jgi:DNA helicase-2/ATP-dependent DNA helicase PcrA